MALVARVILSSYSLVEPPPVWFHQGATSKNSLKKKRQTTRESCVEAMLFDVSRLDEQIERLRVGNTLTENEVRALCEKVSWRPIESLNQ
jgi:hypothetical protein